MIFEAILNRTRQPLRDRNPNMPASLERIVSRLLEKDRSARYASAAETRTDLERLQTGRVPIAAPQRGSQRWKYGVLAAAALFGAAGLLLFWQQRVQSKLLTDKDTIVLADFTNTTDDAVFDGTLRQGLVVQLEQSPFLSLISDERIQRTLGLMGQPADARLTPKLAREICDRTGSAAVLEGSIASLGSQYVLGLGAKNCGTGEIVDEEQTHASRKEEVLDALSQMAAKFRGRVGESLASVKEHNTPLAEATTPSLEALKAYSAGLKHLTGEEDRTAAVRLFQQAIEEVAIARFQAEHTKLQRRLDAMYDDKLDGMIDEAFFRRKADECRAGQAKLTDEIERHQQANQNYIEDGTRLLDLANKAADLFEKQPAPEKRKLLRFVLIGCTWKNGQLGFEYRKPFDLIAEFEQAGKTAKSKTQHSNRDGDRGPAQSEGRKPTEHEGVAPLQIVAGGKSLAGQTGQNEIWLPSLDAFRTQLSLQGSLPPALANLNLSLNYMESMG